jgi:hypothetical protein
MGVGKRKSRLLMYGVQFLIYEEEKRSPNNGGAGIWKLKKIPRGTLDILSFLNSIPLSSFQTEVAPLQKGNDHSPHISRTNLGMNLKVGP